MDLLTLILGKKYVDKSIKGITGTLAGKNCTIKDITKVDNISTVTFEWTADDGTKRTSLINVSDGEQGEDGIGIESIDKIATLGLVDTYQILYSDGTTQNFSITNGKDGVQRVRLTTDGNHIYDKDENALTFVQVKDLIMDSDKFVTLTLDNNISFLPSAYDGNAIWFDAGFIESGVPNQLRVIINDQDQVNLDQIELAKKATVDGLVSDVNTLINSVDELFDFCQISTEADNILTQDSQGALYVKRGESGEPYDDTEVRGLIQANTDDITSLGGRVTNIESDITSIESEIGDLELGIQTNSDNIGDTTKLVVGSWDSLVTAINSLYGGFMQKLEYANKKLTITYRNGATVEIDVSNIITDTNIEEFKDVTVTDIKDNDGLVWDASNNQWVNKPSDSATVLQEAKNYTDQQIAQSQEENAIACDEKPTYDANTDTVTYRQGGVTKTEDDTYSWFYYKNETGNSVQVRWINGVEFLIDVGSVNLEDYVNKNTDVTGEFVENPTDLTKIPNLQYMKSLRDVLIVAIGNKINKTDIVDDLTSEAIDKPLSANQGRVLKNEVDSKLVIVSKTQAEYDELPDDITGKQNPYVIYRITDSGTQVNLINDDKVETTSSWSSQKTNDEIIEIKTTATLNEQSIAENWNSNGYNLVPFPYETLSGVRAGVTCTVNDKDGSVTLNGENTGTTADFIFITNNFNNKDRMYHGEVGQTYMVVYEVDGELPEGCFIASNGFTETGSAVPYFKSDNTQLNKPFTVRSEAQLFSLYITNRADYVFDNVTVRIMLVKVNEDGSYPTTYQKYAKGNVELTTNLGEISANLSELESVLENKADKTALESYQSKYFKTSITDANKAITNGIEAHRVTSTCKNIPVTRIGIILAYASISGTTYRITQEFITNDNNADVRKFIRDGYGTSGTTLTWSAWQELATVEKVNNLIKTVKVVVTPSSLTWTKSAQGLYYTNITVPEIEDKTVIGLYRHSWKNHAHLMDLAYASGAGNVVQLLSEVNTFATGSEIGFTVSYID